MKKLAAICLILFLFGCDGNQVLNEDNIGKLKVTFDNEPVVTSEVYALLHGTGERLIINAYMYGSVASGPFSLDINSLNASEAVQEGTYKMPASATCIYHTGTSGTPSFGSYSGELMLTEIDRTNHTVSGTFETNIIRSSDSKTIKLTRGSFTKIEYTP